MRSPELIELGERNVRDSDLDSMDRNELLETARSLRTAIRQHRDERGHYRCWLDDLELYGALPNKAAPDLALPPREIFLTNCARYWANRQPPGCPSSRPRVRQIEGGSWTIGQGQLEDASALAAMDKRLWGDWSYPIPYYVQLLDHSPESVHVAKMGTTLAGAAVGMISNSLTRGHVWSVDVVPEHRRYGLGSKLVSSLIDFFESSGVNIVTAWVAENNGPSRGLFERLGFHPDRIVPDAFGDLQTQILYRRACSGE